MTFRVVDAAEVDLDHIPELLGEMERLRAILRARLTIRSNRPQPIDDRDSSEGKAAAQGPKPVHQRPHLVDRA